MAGLISNSGTALSFNPNTFQYSTSSFYNLSGTLGCGGASADPATVVACVREKNSSAVLAASLKPPPLPSKTGIFQPVFQPTVDNVTVFGDYQALSDAHAYAKIPYLLGNNKNEDGTYRVNAYIANVSLTDAQWAAFDRAAFTCATRNEANSRAAAGVPVWRWFYNGVWDNLNLYPNAGTYHGSELSLIFGTTLNLTGQADSPAEAKIGQDFMKVWAAFASNPTSGLTKIGWKIYSPNGRRGPIHLTLCRKLTLKSAATLATLPSSSSDSPTLVNPNTVDSQCPAKNDPSPAMGAF